MEKVWLRIIAKGYPWAMNFSDTTDIKSVIKEIDKALAEFCRTEVSYLSAIGSEMDPVAKAMEKFILQGGKRLRPLFAYVGYLASGGKINDSIFRAFASLELVHACALIHDDVMDGSDTRRGEPAIHKQFEELHIKNKLSGSPEKFGIASAILLGDLALIWSAQMFHSSKISEHQIKRALPIYDEMRVELMAGQYLDVYEQALATSNVDRSLKVARYKSGKYTIERPLHFGLKLNEDSKPLLQQVFTDYGIPLGEAFQLRDDVLGIFGDPAQTGKPAGDDLREGKRTVLMAKAVELANASERKELLNSLGKSDLSTESVANAQQIIKDTGALAAIEKMISDLSETAAHAISKVLITDDGRKLLTQLIVLSTNRKI
jgi:geranylgeranyl diphosphate synthase type I